MQVIYWFSINSDKFFSLYFKIKKLISSDNKKVFNCIDIKMMVCLQGF